MGEFFFFSKRNPYGSVTRMGFPLQQKNPTFRQSFHRNFNTKNHPKTLTNNKYKTTKQNEEHEPAPPHSNKRSEKDEEQEEVEEAAENEQKCTRVKCTDA